MKPQTKSESTICRDGDVSYALCYWYVAWALNDDDSLERYTSNLSGEIHKSELPICRSCGYYRIVKARERK